VSLCPLCLSCFLQPWTQKHLPLLFQTGFRSLPRLQFEFTKFAILNPSGWIFRKFCGNLYCGLISKLSVDQCVCEFPCVCFSANTRGSKHSLWTSYFISSKEICHSTLLNIFTILCSGFFFVVCRAVPLKKKTQFNKTVYFSNRSVVLCYIAWNPILKIM